MSFAVDALARLRRSMGLAATGEEAQRQPPQGSNLNFKQSRDSDDSDEEPASTLETREAAASSNWAKLQAEQQEKKRKEERKARLIKEREAAQRNAKLQGTGLGDADGTETNTLDWLMGSKKRQKVIEKRRAEEERQAEEVKKNRRDYTEADLAGAKVGHEYGDFETGEDQILTLKDRNVDDESDEDELENADLRAKERLQERLDLRKKKKVYDPMQEATGESSILGHYDEEINGKKTKRFTLGDTNTLLKALGEDESRPKGKKYTLFDRADDDVEMTPANDYQEVKVKKSKKKKDKSKSKKATAEDDDEEPAEQPMQIDVPVQQAPRKRQIDESFVDDEDLQANLAASRRSALKKRKLVRPQDLAKRLQDEEPAEEEANGTPFEPRNGIKEEDADAEGGVLIDGTTDFATHLEKEEVRVPRQNPEEQQSWRPTPSHDDDADDSEDEADEDGDKQMHNPDNDLSPDRDTAHDHDHDATQVTTTGLDEEQTMDIGLGGAMRLLTQRGLLNADTAPESNAAHRSRQKFLIEKQKREEEAERRARFQREKDRASGRFERMSAREREAYAARENLRRDQAESRSMADVFNREYRPNVDIKYTDEYGRPMDQHEAFKHLSHQFHGKGSGAMKTEKRLKKIGEEQEREARSLLDSGEKTKAAGQAAKTSKQAGVRLQ